MSKTFLSQPDVCTLPQVPAATCLGMRHSPQDGHDHQPLLLGWHLHACVGMIFLFQRTNYALLKRNKDKYPNLGDKDLHHIFLIYFLKPT